MLLVWIAGCGFWREVQTESFSELTVDLQEFISLNDPYRDRVKGLLDDAWIASHYGGVSTFSGIAFELAFDRCASDGSFDEGEFSRLQALARAFELPELDDGQRATVLRRKAGMDATVRASRGPQRRRGRSEDGGSDIANWVLPGDLQDAVESSGWDVLGCHDDEIDGIHFVSCELKQSQFFANVQVDRYPKPDLAKQAAESHQANSFVVVDGDTLMTTTVLDGDSAIILRDAIVPEGDAVALLTRYELTRAVKGGSWEVDCTPLPRGDDSKQRVNCEATKAGRNALIEVVIDSSDRGTQRTRLNKRRKLLFESQDRILQDGIAGIYQDQSSLEATVANGTVARELSEAILR